MCWRDTPTHHPQMRTTDIRKHFTCPWRIWVRMAGIKSVQLCNNWGTNMQRHTCAHIQTLKFQWVDESLNLIIAICPEMIIICGILVATSSCQSWWWYPLPFCIMFSGCHWCVCAVGQCLNEVAYLPGVQQEAGRQQERMADQLAAAQERTKGPRPK